MTKAELVQRISNDAGIRKVEAERALKGFINALTSTLKKGEKVTLVGFGTFSVSERAAREGKNPKNQKVIKIPARKVVKFKASKVLKESI